MNYKNPAHATIYKTYLTKSRCKFSNRTLAGIFLLSADRDVWKRAKDAIVDKTILFDQIDHNDLSNYGYALLSIAKDICEKTTHINVYDLSDPYLISNKTLGLIFSAIEIARKGYPATGVKRDFR